MHDLLLAPFLAANPGDYGVSYPFQFSQLVLGLVWAVWLVLNLWIWQKTKAKSNLLMMIGAAVLVLTYIMRSFTWDAPGAWIEIAAVVTVTVGFYLSVKPLVEAQLAKLREKLQSVTSKKDAPPPAAK